MSKAVFSAQSAPSASLLEASVLPRTSIREAQRSHTRAVRRLLGVAALLIAGCCALTACSPEPTTPTPISLPSTNSEAPSSTPSPLPSSVSLDDPEIAELFYQAERAFTAYNEAEDNLDYRDMATVQRLYDLTADPYQETLKALEAERVAEGVHFVGESRVISITPLGLDDQLLPVVHVCFDLSQGELVKASGEPVYESNGIPKVGREITFTTLNDGSSSDGRLLVSGFYGYAGEVLCQ